jgi:hypothetical protein
MVGACPLCQVGEWLQPRPRTLGGIAKSEPEPCTLRGKVPESK